MNPQFPIYIISKGRWQSRLTSKELERLGVPYRIVVEEQERQQYAAVIDPKKILILDPQYQRDYDPCCELQPGQSKGSGPARNFVWDHSISEGHPWHWVMDDNLRHFLRLNRNLKGWVQDGTILKVMEDFALRYENVAQFGPAYKMFAPRRRKINQIVFNTRIYSCICIRNDIPFRWRARYNEDTDLSLRILKAGWCTIQFYAFLADKMRTQNMKGGNTDELYKHGTVDKTQMLRDLHPDVTDIRWRYSRVHHYVDYSRFQKNKLILKPHLELKPGVDNYGMEMVRLS